MFVTLEAHYFRELCKGNLSLGSNMIKRTRCLRFFSLSHFEYSQRRRYPRTHRDDPWPPATQSLELRPWGNHLRGPVSHRMEYVSLVQKCEALRAHMAHRIFKPSRSPSSAQSNLEEAAYGSQPKFFGITPRTKPKR
jgi:hypothetical protein